MKKQEWTSKDLAFKQCHESLSNTLECGSQVLINKIEEKNRKYKCNDTFEIYLTVLDYAKILSEYMQ